MSIVSAAPAGHARGAEYVLLEGVRFSTYETLLEDMGDRRLRLTYENGSLEIRSVSPRHEWAKKLIGRMIEAMTEELSISIRSGGSTTFKKELSKKGLEPDASYWVANERAVRGRPDLEIELDPPPDIAVEVEISTSALNRLAIYAAIGVSEIWRSDGSQILISQLQDDGSYVPVPQSPSFPWLPVAGLSRFLSAGMSMSETQWIRSFRTWIRTAVSPLAPEVTDLPE
jgi:Uma2 family endonuclease